MDAIARRNLLLAGALAAPAVAAVMDSAQADTAFSSYAYPVGVSTASRTTSTRFSEVLSVKDFGAQGDGMTDDTAAIQACFNAAFGPSTAAHGGFLDVGSSIYKNASVFFPNGLYITSDQLVLTAATGCRIFGSTPRSVLIQNNSTTGSAVIFVNLMQDFVIDNMSLFLPNSTGICLNMTGDLVNTPGLPLACNLQSVSIYNLRTDGGSHGSQIGVGPGAIQGSEYVWMNCSFNNHTIAGMAPAQQNAIQHWVYGGECNNCGVGLYCQNDGGNITTIEGVIFKNQPTAGSLSSIFDIKVDVSSPDCYYVAGCRTTSTNFLWTTAGTGMVIEGCLQTSTAGIFLHAEGTTFPPASYEPGSIAVNNCQIGGAFNGNMGLYLSGNVLVSSLPVFQLNNSNGGLITGYVPSSALSVAGLPSAALAGGLRISVADSSVDPSHSSNYGVVISAGGGSFTAPVWSDATNWRLG